MAYLHCHSCDWSQDDFWTKRYNPISTLIEDIKHCIKPRFIQMDSSCLKELKEGTIVPIFVIPKNKAHSWNFFHFTFRRFYRVTKNMKWPTFNYWKKYKDTAVCPKCGAQDFDID